MINDKKVLAIIPARGGSKGVLRKNIKELAGKPLIAWTIEEAKKSKYIDRLILSSEDDEIIKIAKEFGCEAPFVRPSELAQDDTPGIIPLLHALEEVIGYDYIVSLQPTSPLRIVDDIDACIEKMIATRSPACVSVAEPTNSPYWMYTVDEKENMVPLIKQDNLTTRRQDLPSVYLLNGAVYVAEVTWLKQTASFLTAETTAFIMPNNRSHDIDTEEDFLLVDSLLRKLFVI
ncbi:acylneuraminate cytidylyltransferase family protein [Sporosarcina beigongshangi]|uniref:acylneuraminate cytidylyltransferase family protein n=1 Tax=Sporosarcina beigongshangi TaxID=2782538 RepID=UPI00193A4310|nr:acylneuraminate cytidylyltransferase family protein [Sporosarcina beigongshangi]